MMSYVSCRCLTIPLRSNLNRLIRSDVLKRTFSISTLYSPSFSPRIAATQEKQLKCFARLREVQRIDLRTFCSGKLPDHNKIFLPALSPTMSTGNVVSWQKKEGDRLDEGDLLCEIETDKATMGFETPEEGYLAKILLPQGSKGIPVGKLLCIIVSSQEHVSAFKSFVDDGSTGATGGSAPPATAKVPTSSESLPDHNEVTLPALSPTMKTGNVVSWQKKEGDFLGEGEVMCEIETDKSVMGFETPEEGYLAKILLPEGTKGVALGTPLCVIVPNKEDVAKFANYVAKVVVAPTTPSAESTPSAPPSAPSAAPVSAAPAAQKMDVAAKKGRLLVSPMAKRIAADKGIDLSAVVGTGPGGRIVAKDVENFVPSSKPVQVKTGALAAAASLPVAGYRAFIDIPLTNMRTTIAKRLFESKTTIPHYYLTSEIHMDNLFKVREQLNEMVKNAGQDEEEEEVLKLSVNDFIIKASALACQRIPEANSFFMESFIRQNSAVDISVAVSTDEGLITPIVFNAESKGLLAISTEVRNLAVRARQGNLLPEEFQGGTFTVSNLGMFGSIHDFSAIINPPQSCILAVGGTEEKIVPDGEGYKRVPSMHVTLSCDHRVVDGAVGAQWLKHFKNLLENPQTMLL